MIDWFARDYENGCFQHMEVAKFCSSLSLAADLRKMKWALQQALTTIHLLRVAVQRLYGDKERANGML
jgi:hypothetical protein